MNDLKDTKTADLIAKWSLCKRAITYISNRESSHGGVWQRAKKQRCINETERIATELDMRCVEAGISIYENQFVYNTTEFWITHGRFLEHDIMAIAANGNMPAKEQHDLEGWLLLKEGGGK